MKNIITERKRILKKEIEVANRLLLHNLKGINTNGVVGNTGGQDSFNLTIMDAVDSLQWLTDNTLSKDNKFRKGVKYINYGVKLSKAIKKSG